MKRWFLGLAPEQAAVLLVVATYLCFSLMDVIALGLTRRYDPLQVVWARYVSQTFWAFLILAPRVPALLRTRRPGLQVLRSAFLFFATLSFFSAFTVMSLASTAAIFQVGPLFVTVLAFFVLGERVGPRRWTGVVIGLCGALLIIRPGTEVFGPFALLALAGAASNAGYAITTRMLGQGESAWTNFLYTALLGAVGASIAVPFVWTTPDLADAAVMATFGILGGCGHLLLIFALRMAPASVVAPFGYLAVAYAAFWGFVVFGQVPDRWTVAGALVIVGAGLYVWHRERQVKRAPPRSVHVSGHTP